MKGVGYHPIEFAMGFPYYRQYDVTIVRHVVQFKPIQTKFKILFEVLQ